MILQEADHHHLEGRVRRGEGVIAVTLDPATAPGISRASPSASPSPSSLPPLSTKTGTLTDDRYSGGEARAQ